MFDVWRKAHLRPSCSWAGGGAPPPFNTTFVLSWVVFWVELVGPRTFWLPFNTCFTDGPAEKLLPAVAPRLVRCPTFDPNPRWPPALNWLVPRVATGGAAPLPWRWFSG